MKKRIFLLLLLAAALPLLLPHDAPPEAAEVRTLSASTVYTSVRCQGTVEPYRTIALGVPSAALAEKLFVSVGDRVQQGQLLMTYREGESSGGDPELWGLLSAAADRLGLSGELPDRSYAHDGCLEAPFDGRILRVDAVEQEQVSPWLGALQLCDDRRMFVRLQVSESELRELMPGMPVTVAGDSFSGCRSGVVIEASPAIRKKLSLSASTSSYGEVLCELYDSRDIPPGSTVDATISVSRISNAIVVPYGAILQDEAGNEYVYLLRDGRAEKRIITTSVDLGDEVWVSSGLFPGEELILSETEEGKAVRGAIS